MIDFYLICIFQKNKKPAFSVSSRKSLLSLTNENIIYYIFLDVNFCTLGNTIEKRLNLSKTNDCNYPKKNFRLFFINSQELFQVENEFQD